MSPIISYRRLLDLAGPGYVAVAFLGRLPLAMSQLGSLLLVSSATGRFAAGGFAAGALAVANAIGAPVAGGVADRVGQRPVVMVQALASSAALAALVGLVSAGAPLAAVIVAAAVAGLSMPQVGSLARVRWRPIAREAGTVQPRLVDAAFSYEGAADEASFVLGPATLLAGATGIGYAIGSGAAGRLADTGGHTPAFAVAVTAGALAVTLAVSLSARRRRQTG